jgi:hypothetical protein
MSYKEKSISSLCKLGFIRNQYISEQQGNIILCRILKTAVYLTQSL